MQVLHRAISFSCISKRNPFHLLRIAKDYARSGLYEQHDDVSILDEVANGPLRVRTMQHVCT